MTNIIVTISGSAQRLLRSLRDSNTELNRFNVSGRQASAAMASFTGNLASSAVSAFAGQLINFAKGSVEAAREGLNVKNALLATLGAGTDYSAIITNATEVTRGMTDEATLAGNILSVMGQGLAANTDEAAKLSNASAILSSIFKEAGGSQQAFNKLLATGNAVLLDNFQISKPQLALRKEQIEATSALSGEEANLAAIKELLIEKAELLGASLSKETIAALQADAAFANMQGTLGTALLPATTAMNLQLAIFGDELSRSIQGVNFATETMGIFKESTQAANIPLEAWRAIQTDLELLLTKGTGFLIENTIGWDDLALKYGETGDAAGDLEDGQESLTESLEGVKQEFIEINEAQNEFLDLTTTGIEKISEFRARIINDAEGAAEELAEIRAADAEAQLEIDTELAEGKKEIEEDRAKAIERIDKQITDFQNKARTQSLSLSSQTQKNITANQLKNLKERRANLIEEENQTAREQISILEAEAVEARKIQAATTDARLIENSEVTADVRKQQEKQLFAIGVANTLQLAEASGTLEKITGISGRSAEQLTKDYLTGARQIPETMLPALTESMNELNKNADIAAVTLQANNADLLLSFTGTTVALGTVAPEVKAMTTDMSNSFALMATNTKKSVDVAVDLATLKTQETRQDLFLVDRRALQTFKNVTKILSRIESQAARVRGGVLATLAQRPRARVPSTIGQSGASGQGFQQGGQGIVPPGFEGDTFPIFLSSGERFKVETPAQQITNNNFTQNVTTVQPTAGVVQNFATMQALVGQ